MSFHFRHDGLYINGVFHATDKSVKDSRKAVAEHIKAMLGMV